MPPPVSAGASSRLVGTLTVDMGRCYEFGPVIGPGCEHTMVVPSSGGRCECPNCGVICEGRFSGCAAVIAKPGYVHALAPPSARQPQAVGAVAPIAENETTTRPEAPVELLSPERASKNGSSLDHVGESATVTMAPDVRRFLTELRTMLDARDAELVETFTRLEDAYTALVAKVDEVHEGQRRIEELLDALQPQIGRSDAVDRAMTSLRGFFGRT